MTAAAEPSRPAIPPGPAPEAIELRAHTWPGRLRAVAQLADELEDLESCATLTASSRRPELRGAGEWLEDALELLAGELAAPDLDGLLDAIGQVRAARDNLAQVVAASRAGGAA